MIDKWASKNGEKQYISMRCASHAHHNKKKMKKSSTMKIGNFEKKTEMFQMFPLSEFKLMKI